MDWEADGSCAVPVVVDADSGIDEEEARSFKP